MNKEISKDSKYRGKVKVKSFSEKSENDITFDTDQNAENKPAFDKEVALFLRALLKMCRKQVGI